MFKQKYFVIAVCALSLIFSFLAGYVTFRYLQLEICKSPMEVGTFGEGKIKVSCENGC